MMLDCIDVVGVVPNDNIMSLYTSVSRTYGLRQILLYIVSSVYYLPHIRSTE